MEISKSLQEEIRAVQNKLKNAIQNHQVFVGKLSADPNNEELIGQLHEIQEHIIALSKCQKQVVQRLRKEVNMYEAANSNGIKVSIGSILGLNNNNNITNNNETKSNDNEIRNVNGNDLNGLTTSRRYSKDDYEDVIHPPSPPNSAKNCDNDCPKERTSFEESDSNDGDVIEIKTGVVNSVDKLRNDGTVEASKNEICEQLDFLGSLGLITSDKHTELQNKRAERKRRSTENPQFVYSNWEIPTKRKKHSYLQSNGTAPQTRQTTARLNGPSPPPPPPPLPPPPPSSTSLNKPGNLKPPSPPSRQSIKSLIPTQKSSTRPNILRNNSESKLFSAKIKTENGFTKTQQQQQHQQQQFCTVKPIQSIPVSKAVHIPGLPSSLTIERIENDSTAVCIHCRNPGSLTLCQICEANFHVSCHGSNGSGSSKFCPKCYAKTKERERDRDAASSSSSSSSNSCSTLVREFKREDEIAATSDAPGIIGKAGKDSEIDKTACGFYKVDATEERTALPSAIGVNQLPSSTFLIPIAPNAIPSSAVDDDGQPESVVAGKPGSVSADKESSYSSIRIEELSKSDEGPEVSYAYNLSVDDGLQSGNSEFAVEKMSESGGIAETTSIPTRRIRQLSVSSNIPGSKLVRRRSSTSAIFDYQQFSSTGYNDHDQSEIKSLSSVEPREFGRKFFCNGEREEDSRGDKSSGKFEGDRSRRKFHSKFNITKLRPGRYSNSFVSLHNIITRPDAVDKVERGKNTKSGCGTSATNIKSKKNLLYSLFSSNNEPDSFPGCSFKSKNSVGGEQSEVEPELDIESREIGYQKRAESEPRLDYSYRKNVAEYVKLEEAHLPAPFRPNLGVKTVEEIRAILGKKMGASSSSNSNSNSTSSSSSSSSRDERNSEPLETETREKLSIAKSLISFKDYHDKSLRETLDFIATERKHSNTYIKFHDFEESDDSSENMPSEGNRKDKPSNESKTANTISGTMLAKKNSYPLLRKKLLPNEIKAEIERQDLPVNDSGLSNKEDEEEDEVEKEGQEEEEEEEEAEDKIKRNTLPEKRSKPKSGINVVSSENMLVLEQFESAMLGAADEEEEEEGEEEETANCLN